jgi:hypothetical protein
MKVIDRTVEFINILAVSGYKLFCFNHGLAKINLSGGCLKIIVVRLILTNKHDHPWRVWGSNYYGGHSRDKLGGSIIHKYGVCINRIDDHLFDSTGIIIYDKDDKIIMATNKLFGDEWNQDCRITVNENKIFLTYNSRINGQIVMLIRTLQIGCDSIELSDEQYVHNGYIKGIEKNWVMWGRYIFYAINGFHIILEKDHIVPTVRYHHSIKPIQHILEKYGRKNIFFSLSCPPIQFSEDEILAVGHLKISCAKKYKKKLPFNKFLAMTINNEKKSDIYRRYSYAYFIFYYTFNPSSFQIKRISDALIPYDNHLPYLLVFPISLIQHGEEFTVTYGEGDVRCKELTINRSGINSLLLEINHINAFNFNFRFI